jgi:Na+-transporting methylmalonyl-CoA/oxaloacetate decarboxylase gamma subunit
MISLALSTVAAIVPPTVTRGWSMTDVFALLTLLIVGARQIVDAIRAVLHLTAPRTKTMFDDRAAAMFDDFHDRLVALEAQVPRATSAPAEGVHLADPISAK